MQRDALRLLVFVSVKWRNVANYKGHLVVAAIGVRWDFLPQFQDRQAIGRPGAVSTRLQHVGIWRRHSALRLARRFR